MPNYKKDFRIGSPFSYGKGRGSKVKIGGRAAKASVLTFLDIYVTMTLMKQEHEQKQENLIETTVPEGEKEVAVRKESFLRRLGRTGREAFSGGLGDNYRYLAALDAQYSEILRIKNDRNLSADEKEEAVGRVVRGTTEAHR